ncbi:MAG: hypothetical protein GY756_25410 [bacterium]|nr:hypothetical protein [bacterium]
MENKKKYITVGNIFNEAFNLYFNNFTKLCMPFIIVSFPTTLLIQIYQKNIIDSFPQSDTIPILALTFVFSMLSYFIYSIVVLFIIIISARAYNGEKELLSISFNKYFKKLFPCFILVFLMYMALTIGFVLLLIPGIILALGWYVVTVVLVEEDEGIIGSFSRSWNLTKGYKGTLFVISILIGLIVIAFLAILSVIVSKLVSGSIASITTISNNPDSTENIIIYLLSQIIAPIYTCIVVVVYYNLKKEKESFETEQLADSFLDETKDSPIE